MNDMKKKMLKYKKGTKFPLFILFITVLLVVTAIVASALYGFQVEFDFLENIYVCLGIGGGIGFLMAYGLIAYFAKTANAIKEIGSESDSRDKIIKALDSEVPVFEPTEKKAVKADNKTIVKSINTAATKTLEKEIRTQLKPTIDVFDFKFIDKNTAMEAVIKTYNEVNVVVPAVHNGFPVRAVSTSISETEEPRLVESVYFPKSIRTIGDNVFTNCSLLKAVTINTGVTKIGPNAFLNCKRLTEVFIPDSVVSCGANAFRGNPLLIIKLAHEFKPADFDIQYKDDATTVMYKCTR